MIPFAVKLFYTLFVCVLAPVYWRHYGLANFLWFSDLALLIGLAATWLENPLLASMQAVSVLLPQLVWILDFFGRSVTGKPIIRIAEYMFKCDKPLFVRGLSLFHLVLPFFLVWLVYVLGYDFRGWILQTFCSGRWCSHATFFQSRRTTSTASSASAAGLSIKSPPRSIWRCSWSASRSAFICPRIFF